MKMPVLSILALLLFFAVPVPSVVGSVSGYCVPNEIIVKFRAPAAERIENQLQVLNSADVPNLSPLSSQLAPLDKKFKVSRIKPLLKDFKDRQLRLESLKETLDGLPVKKRKRILKRLKRAPKAAKVPNLGCIYRIQLDGESRQSLEEALVEFKSNPDVEYAEVNYIVSVNSVPNDPLYADQWALSRIAAEGAWSIYTGSPETVVAVLDTGVDYNHRDLRDNMWVNEAEMNGAVGIDDDENGYVDDIYGYNFIYNSGDPMDDYGHGTYCSGIIAAGGNNALDITGICWNTRIMALKFMGLFGDGSTSDAVLAVYYAVENGADVISNSWSTPDESLLLKDAVDYAHSQGVIIVASAGNDGSNLPQYPSCYNNVISVAATDSDDRKWPYSNYGDCVDIAAPGVDVLSLSADGTSIGVSNSGYTTKLSGTSTACPHVAGACALLLSVNPLMTFEQVYSVLTRTADPISPGICISNGRINLSQAMHAVIPQRGYISFDSDYYACPGNVSLLLADWDLRGIGSQDATVMTSGGDLEKIVLTENASVSGVFTGTVYADSGEPVKEDGILNVFSGEVITAIYFDANDGTGNPSATMDNALTDCEAPVLLDVQIETVNLSAIVMLTSNESTRVQVRYGLDRGGPYPFVQEAKIPAQEHVIKLWPLSVDTDYFFVVDMVDAVGNKVTVDNNGLCYSFTTSAEFSGFRVPDVYPTIQAAIDDASDGDTVWIADGQYSGEGNLDIDFKGKAITVKSENGPQNCIIDCQFKGRGFDFHSGENEKSVLDSVTITNGTAGGFGGGIKCTASSPSIINCIIKGNSAGEYGGGMCNSYNSSPKLSNCIFSGNSAESKLSALGSGGGICNMVNSSPVLDNCTFSENFANHSGAGMYNSENSNPIITICTFSENTARHGGGMYNCYDSTPRLANCIFSENLAEYGGAVKNSEAIAVLTNCTLSGNSAEMGGGIWNGWGGSVELANSILWDNSDSGGRDESAQINNSQGSRIPAINYCCIQGWTGALGGIGNIGADPLFADPDAGDYHLKSTGWRWDAEHLKWLSDDMTSQCIDAGNPGSPLKEELSSTPGDPVNMWGANIRINMGCYGGTAEASMPPYGWRFLGDMTNDGVVDSRDFAVQAQYWIRSGEELPGDLDRNGTVDTADLAILAEDWLKHYNVEN